MSEAFQIRFIAEHCVKHHTHVVNLVGEISTDCKDHGLGLLRSVHDGPAFLLLRPRLLNLLVFGLNSFHGVLLVSEVEFRGHEREEERYDSDNSRRDTKVFHRFVVRCMVWT